MSYDLPDVVSNPDAEQDLLLGIVVAIQANFYQVQLQHSSDAPLAPDSTEIDSAPNPTEAAPAGSDAAIEPSQLLCTRRSRLMKTGQKVMVGDQVVIEEPDWQGKRGAIADILPRRSQLDRPPVANADQILLVFALAEPELDAHQLSRFLVKAESTGLEVVLALSKSDLISAEKQAEWRDRLQNWGYSPIFISVRQNQGLEQLFPRLNHKITIVSGPSGVGKSSLINALIPQAQLRVGEVSGKLARGRHTTRHVELFELPSGGLLADTPGFNQPELTCLPEELPFYFPEIRDRLDKADCQFSDCLHREEPNCAVKGPWERYRDYLEFLEDAIAYKQALERQANPEATFKRKTARKGQEQLEPKLATQKYRRPSRRTQQQTLMSDNHELEEL